MAKNKEWHGMLRIFSPAAEQTTGAQPLCETPSLAQHFCSPVFLTALRALTVPQQD